MVREDFFKMVHDQFQVDPIVLLRAILSVPFSDVLTISNGLPSF